MAGQPFVGGFVGDLINKITQTPIAQKVIQSQFVQKLTQAPGQFWQGVTSEPEKLMRSPAWSGLSETNKPTAEQLGQTLALMGVAMPLEGVGIKAAKEAPAVAEQASRIIPEGESVLSNVGNLVKSFFRGKNVRVAESNQLANSLEKLIPNPVDRAGLTFHRELKNNPQLLKKLQDLVASGNQAIQPYINEIQAALKGHPYFDQANKLLDQYFKGRAAEGQQLGYLKTELPNYITHLLQFGENGLNPHEFPTQPTFSQFTPFGKSRSYPTIIDAVLSGEKPKTLDPSSLVRIYGSKDALANASARVIRELHDSNTGRWFSPPEIPQGWTDLSQASKHFEKSIPFKTVQGTTEFGTQRFAVPDKIAESLKPLLDKSNFQETPLKGFRQAQQWAKYIDLSLSLFHSKALSLVSAASQGPIDTIKNLRADFENPVFQQAEKEFINAGGVSPIVQQTQKAYKQISSNPAIRVFDSLANTTNSLTFDQMQRKFKVMDYANRMASWIAKNPNVADDAVKMQQEKVAKMVNSLYGGLNWQELGWMKDHLNIARTLALAPDWTVSNFLLPFQAIKGQIPKGSAGAFAAKAVLDGVIASQLMNTFLHGKVYPGKPADVYLGKRKDGTQVWSNSMFMPGNISDIANLGSKLTTEGVGGITDFARTKEAPLIGPIISLLSNRDWQGNPIYSSALGPVKSTENVAGHIFSGIPLPFTLQKPIQTFLQSKGQALPLEYIIGASGMGRINTQNPRTQIFKQAHDKAIQQGKSEFSATAKGLGAVRKVYGTKPKTKPSQNAIQDALKTLGL